MLNEYILLQLVNWRDPLTVENACTCCLTVVPSDLLQRSCPTLMFYTVQSRPLVETALDMARHWC